MDVPPTLGKYEIRGTLGRGAMGVVHDGWDPLIARRVAVKSVPLPATPDPETAEEIARFRREAQAAGRLSHPNIVAVYDYGETADLAYIVMEYVDGPTLKALLDKKERFPLDSIKRIMGDVLAGLQFSHERGVVHRDIKPANIMLTSQGQAKIADFGIARIEMSSMTQAGTMLGTPAYMSPEQFRGEAADARTDVYSAGVLLYQLLTGERPFEGGLTAIMHKVLNTEPPAPSQLAGTVPPGIDAVVQKAMAKRPADRFASAGAFAEALRNAVTTPAAAAVEDEDGATLVRPSRPAVASPAAARPAAPPPVAAAAPAKSRLPLFAGVAVVALLVIGGAGWFLTRPAAPPPAQTAEATPAPSTPPVAETRPAPVQPPATTQVQPTPAPAAPQVQPAEPTVAPVVPPAPAPAATAPTPPAATAVIAPEPTPAPAPATPQVAAKPAEPPPAPAPTPARTPAPAPLATATVAPQPQPQPQPQPATPAPPPAVVPSPPPAPATQTAGIVPAAMLQQIAQALHGARCTLADAALQDGGGVSVSGFADAGAAGSLRQQVDAVPGAQPVAWHVRTVDPVFCATLGLLRPISAQAGVPGRGVGLTLAGDRTVLQDGQAILPRLTMPDFAGELRVDYFAHDGTLAHLYPTAADPAAKLTTQPSRKLAAGEHLSLGDPGPGRPQWQSGEPYGTDMIIAVASSVPLRVSAPHNAEEKGETYIAELGRAIEQARAAGARVSGALLPVEAVPKAN